MKRIFYILIAIVLAAGVICTSCVNEEIDGPLLKGEGSLSLDVAFRPLNDPLTTRSAGDAIKHINNLSIVIYKSDGSLHSNTYYTNAESGENTFTTEEVTPVDYPVSEDPQRDGFAEETTCRTSTITIPKIAYGKYRMYAVANMNRALSEAETETEEALKSIQLTWNADNIAANNAMFGFFDTEENKASAKSTAPEIVINDLTMSLHAWVRRAASKVTIAYDGSNLNENVYIYIHSAQIKDIPATCFLGKDNTPTSAGQLIADGEMIDYVNGSRTARSTGLVVTKGNPVHGSFDHNEYDYSLFFFENMQGDAPTVKEGGYGKLQDETGAGTTVTNPNGSTPTDPDYKDGVPYGSYIEVKGFYVNKTATNASQGEIVYRFMLGKDIIRDCNAERNNHYKLTLKFKNDANNPDWHIEYTPENPELGVPNQLYISYGYNEKLDIPVVVKGASANSNTTITATIIENPWGDLGHPYYWMTAFDGSDGFLAFDKSDKVSISASERNVWTYSKNIYPDRVETDACYYTVPVYTRPLILDESLTGHNPYTAWERRAKVEFRVTMDSKTYIDTLEVIQVKRLVNPAGVWRSDNNTSKFNIRLMELSESDVDDNGMVDVPFTAPLSDGPWTAHIEAGSDWVQISPTDQNAWGTADIVGGTGSEIRFDYRPKNVNTTGSVRSGVIRITYHNNQCVHYVFVSQGLGTVNLAGTKWQNRNILAQDALVANPLMEGSMFKFGNPWYGILVENNYREGYGFNQDCWGKTFITTHNRDELLFSTAEGIGFNLTTGFTSDRVIFTDGSARPASYAEWRALESLHRRYGVMYGDECTETMTTTTEAYSYWQVGHKRGMEGMFVWDQNQNGNHVFFPIGSTGYGHRKVNDDANGVYAANDRWCLLKYAQRPTEMPSETAVKLPMYYDLWKRKGAVYWYDVVCSSAIDFYGTSTIGYAHDINHHTMLLQTYGSNATGQTDRNNYASTDACFIRCVEP